MKRIAFTFGFLAATALAAPLAAQSGSGPWWDPANTGNRGTTDTRNGTIHDRNGRVIGNTRADGQWRREGRDRNGNFIYVRTRFDSNGNLVQERALRDRLGRYRVIDRRVVRSVNDRRRGRDRDSDNRNRNRDSDNRNRNRDSDRNNDGWEDRRGNDRNDRNDRWAQNGGHDNGKHNGWYKDKDKNKSKGKGRNR